jgi:hypothetical protein
LRKGASLVDQDAAATMVDERIQQSAPRYIEKFVDTLTDVRPETSSVRGKMEAEPLSMALGF